MLLFLFLFESAQLKLPKSLFLLLLKISDLDKLRLLGTQQMLRLAHRDFGVLGQVRPHEQALDTEQVLVSSPNVELQMYLRHL